MDAIEALLTRRTVPPALLGEPAPDEAALKTMFAAAAAAPDHGRLRPWRFLIVRAEARQRLGELFACALAAEQPDLPLSEREKLRGAPLRAPLVLVAVARIDPAHPKIPEVEQLAAAAAAVQNLLLAAHALGFAAKWTTGKPAYSPAVRHGLGLAETERILGFIYLGTPLGTPQTIDRSVPADRVSVWTGSAP